MSQTYEYFGKYILLEKLAAGGMAEVFLARAPSAAGIAKFVAMKRILPQYSDNPDFIDMFKDEAKIAINLSHSNIVSIYEFGVEASRFFLVMDYVEGRNLRQILNKLKKSKNSKLTTEQIIFIIKEVAAGLDHAHRCLDGTTGKPLNITHRDMSPQNVMLSFEGEIKIVDFGIAKAESQMETTRAGTLKGKFGYMSPEQAEGQPIDLRTDIFSLGIVLWELLANDRLFMANNEMNTLRKIRDCQVPSLRKINPSIHPELERIAMKALSKDKNMRYQTAAAMHRDMNRFLNRQFPDFSPQDFSVFVKTLYADEILETRKRTVGYSQIPFRDGTALPIQSPITMTDEKTAIAKSGLYDIGDRSNTAGPNGEVADETEKSISHVEMPEGLGPNDMKNAKTVVANRQSIIDEKVETSSGIISPNQNLQRDMVRNNRTQSQSIQMPKATDENTGNYKGTGTRSQVRVYEKKQSFTTQVLMSAMIALIGYFGATTFFPEQSKPYTRVVDQWVNRAMGKAGQTSESSNQAKRREKLEDFMAPNAQVADTSANGKTNLVINSTPSGAEIYINGAPTGKSTPSYVQVSTTQKFSLSLRKVDYLEYERKDMLFSEMMTRTFNATLQRASTGFLDIDVKPAFNAKVYLNGQFLNERLPITGYRVPANAQLTIRAVNPLSGATSEKTLTLRQDERSSIVLLLKSGQTRKPAQK